MTRPSLESVIAQLRHDNEALVRANAKLIVQLHHAESSVRSLVGTVEELQAAVLGKAQAPADVAVGARFH